MMATKISTRSGLRAVPLRRHFHNLRPNGTLIVMSIFRIIPRDDINDCKDSIVFGVKEDRFQWLIEDNYGGPLSDAELQILMQFSCNKTDIYDWLDSAFATLRPYLREQDIANTV
jgi:hypothetical protein